MDVVAVAGIIMLTVAACLLVVAGYYDDLLPRGR